MNTSPHLHDRAIDDVFGCLGLQGGCGQRGGGPKKGCDMKLGMAQPAEDIKRHFHTCAVVGNSMNLFRTPNGPSIDNHQAVMRFNNEW